MSRRRFGIDGVERLELGLARRRRLGRIVDLQRESGRGDDLVDRHARMDAVEPRPGARERDHAEVGDELRRAERAVAGALDPAARRRCGSRPPAAAPAARGRCGRGRRAASGWARRRARGRRESARSARPPRPGSCSPSRRRRPGPAAGTAASSPAARPCPSCPGAARSRACGRRSRAAGTGRASRAARPRRRRAPWPPALEPLRDERGAEGERGAEPDADDVGRVHLAREGARHHVGGVHGAAGSSAAPGSSCGAQPGPFRRSRRCARFRSRGSSTKRLADCVLSAHDGVRVQRGAAPTGRARAGLGRARDRAARRRVRQRGALPEGARPGRPARSASPAASSRSSTAAPVSTTSPTPP